MSRQNDSLSPPTSRNLEATRPQGGTVRLSGYYSDIDGKIRYDVLNCKETAI